MKYLKTTTEEVDAVQFKGNNEQEIQNLLGTSAILWTHQIDERENSAVLRFSIANGEKTVRIGDWITVHPVYGVRIVSDNQFTLTYVKDTTPWNPETDKIKIVPINTFIGEDKLSNEVVEFLKLTVKYLNDAMRTLDSASAEGVWSSIQDTINDTVMIFTPYIFMLPDNDDDKFWIKEYDNENNETGRIAYLEESHE